MASRPIFAPKLYGDIGVNEFQIEFKWHPGMAVVQKQKSIDELHNSAKRDNINSILEVSSKSKDELGRNLSAFNLMITTKIKKQVFSVENAFQSSKVYDNGGPYLDLLNTSAREAKKDSRLKTSGNLIRFKFFGVEYPTEPKTFFYDWLYVNALAQNEQLVFAASLYDAFTDIEFNPVKSINCQAYSISIFYSLVKNNLLKEALLSPENFLSYLKSEYQERDRRLLIQEKLL